MSVVGLPFVHDTIQSDDQLLDSFLDLKSKKGWELVSVAYYPGKIFSGGFISGTHLTGGHYPYVFRRQKKPN